MESEAAFESPFGAAEPTTDGWLHAAADQTAHTLNAATKQRPTSLDISPRFH